MRWKTLFGAEQTGIIELEKFCEVLGLRAQRDQLGSTHEFADQPDSYTGVVQMAGDMPENIKEQISDEARRLLGMFPKLQPCEITKRLKAYLDVEYGRAWHVVLTNGSFHVNFSHAPECSFQFRVANQNFLLWQTPLP
ncbi:unnamed protein product [Dicrocoelium dendriticum]|nr:unnamed protein product [Dicrocoelium dendriticum]